MSSQRTSAVYLGLFMAACFGMFLFLYHLSGGRFVPGQHGYRVEAVVPDALGLSQNADVREAGVRIGRVTRTRNLGGTTALMLELDRSHAPVYRDATVLIRTKSVAGENYLEVNPGRPQAGEVPDGGRLPISSAQEATQLDQVLSVLNPGRRRQLQRALEGLGGGLARRGGDLNHLVEASSAAVRGAAPVTEVLAADREQLAGLVDAFGHVARALGNRRDAIAVLVRQAKVAAEAVGARDAELGRTLTVLPGFLVQTRATAARLQGFSLQATPVVHDLRLAVRDLAPAVAELRSAAPAGRRVVRELLPFARAVKAPVAQLGPFSDAAAVSVPPLADTLRQLNPLLAYLSPYRRELPTLFAQIGAATKYTDSIGHLGRLALTFGRGSLPGTVSPDQVKMLERLGGGEGGFDTLGFNAYPAPGEAGQSKPFAGSYPKLLPEPPYAPGRSP